MESEFGRLRPYTIATLDVPYWSLLAFDTQLPRPTPHSPAEHARLRVRLTRPDGSETEPFATVSLISGDNPPARLTFDELRPNDIPIGTIISDLRYELEANPK